MDPVAPVAWSSHGSEQQENMMTKDDLIAALKGLPGHCEVMIDSPRLNDNIRSIKSVSILVDEGTGLPSIRLSRASPGWRIAMKIWTGAIEHKHGTNFYVSRTEAGVRSQVAKYCREYWTGLESNEDGDPLPHPDLMTDNEVIAAYFEDQSTSSQPESCVIDTAELEDE